MSNGKKKMYWRNFFFTFVSCLSIYFCYSAFSIYSFSKIDETKHCQTAVVLGAAVWGNKPSPVFEKRIKHGIWLYKNGYAKTLLFTGGKGKDKLYSEAFIAKEYAVKNGVPAKDILMEEESTLTQENVENAAEIISEKQISCVLIVSDPIHMKRAMLMARDCKLEAFSSPTRTSKFKSVGSNVNFICTETIYLIGYRIKRLFI